MRIAVFDYFVVDTSPSGSCVLEILRDQAGEHEFTVFSAAFDNPNPERIKWIRVPVIRRPLFLLFVVYQFMASVRFVLHRVLRRAQFDCVLAADDSFLFADIAYLHSCRKAILDQRVEVSGGYARRLARWLSYTLPSAIEPVIFKYARRIIVPSNGTAQDFIARYPEIAGRVGVINNAVRTATDGQNERDSAVRTRLGFAPTDIVVIFVALGNFEHKGLSLLLAALNQAPFPSLGLLVVGGTPGALAPYRNQAAHQDIESRVVFAGMQEKHAVLTLMRNADVFALPSCYEAFPLVALEAASCGLPLLVTRVHGVEDFVLDGENGWLVERSVNSIARALSQIAVMDMSRVRKMGEKARQSIACYSPSAFSRDWRAVLSGND